MNAYFFEDLQECVSDLVFATASLFELLDVAIPNPDISYLATDEPYNLFRSWKVFKSNLYSTQ